MFFWDYTYFLLFRRFSWPSMLKLECAGLTPNTAARRFFGLSGAQLAKEILNLGGAGHVPVEETPGQLSDHYDPRKKLSSIGRGLRKQVHRRPGYRRP